MIESMPTAEPPVTTAPAEALSEPRRELWFKRRVGFRQATRELVEFRALIWALAERDIRVRYKQAVLGMAWALFAPIVMMLVFSLVFRKLGGVNTNGVPYPLFSYMGLIPWSFFSSSVLTGGMSLSSNLPLLNKLYCPREVFPFGTVAVAAADAIVASLILLILFPLVGYWPHWQAVYAPIMILVLVVFTLGVTLAVAGSVVYVRDLRIALPLIVQLGLFVTPVAYGMSAVVSSRTGEIVYSFLNPLAPVIENLRSCVLLGENPDWVTLGAGAITSCVVLVLGFVLFKRLETGFADFA